MGCVMPRRKWTEEEANLLIELFPKKRVDKIAEELGRSVSSVKQKAMQIRKSQGILLRSKNWWTKDEIKELEKLYPTLRNADIAKILDRTKSGVETKAYELGLKKDRETFRKIFTINRRKRDDIWTAEEVEALKEQYPKAKLVADIAKAFGRSTYGVRSKASKLGLKLGNTSNLSHISGRVGERQAEKLFQKLRWKILQKHERHDTPYDFIIEKD